MSTFDLRPEGRKILDVSWVDRWEVYKRLQELDIYCWCEVEQPLWVQLKNADEATQLESVLKQYTANRHELVQLLQRCWQAS